MIADTQAVEGESLSGSRLSVPRRLPTLPKTLPQEPSKSALGAVLVIAPC